MNSRLWKSEGKPSTPPARQQVVDSATSVLAIKCIVCLIPWAVPVLSGCAEPSPPAKRSPDAYALVEELKRIRPNAEVGDPHETPMPNLFGLDVGGGNVVYGTADGSHLIAGDLYALESTLVNLTEQRREARRATLLAEHDISDMIVFTTDEVRTVVNVFTDVDCGHCQRMHRDVAALNGIGIEIRYLAYPRAGLESPSYSRIESAWCAADRHKALTALKLGRDVPKRTCSSPVADQYRLAKEIGLPGTPGIITTNGRLLRGYASVEELAASLGLD